VGTTWQAQMRRALELAERGWGRVSPNPMVGAVVLDDAGTVVGEGWHEGPGSAHAEVMALAAAGDRARGATVVCTLEPCDRFGRTPPCTRALIDAGVARVVVGTTDPHLGDAAPGLAELRRAGVAVERGVLADASRRLNRAFERHVTTGLPWVTLKTAASLDGKTAARDGSSRWISGVEARADTHRLRAWADAIVVGAGTATADDPKLTVRDERYTAARPTLRVVVDSAGRVPPTASMFDDATPTVVATTAATTDRRIDEWGATGADVLVLDRGNSGGVALPALVAALGKRDVQGVLVEGGATLAWSFVRDGLVDDVVCYVAPKLVGGAGAPGVLGGEGFASIADALDLTFTGVDRVGADLRLEADVHGHR
jgi:diaminohydroxyphosphoribosylaminopyrimidine deaminase / 5-amino-6-(5-phosphoribosylamino)uracil reductase